jgi:hypothetical protein
LDIRTRRLGEGEVSEVDGLRIGGGGGGIRRSGLPRRFRWRSELRNRQDWQTLSGNNNDSRRPRKSICHYIFRTWSVPEVCGKL